MKKNLILMLVSLVLFIFVISACKDNTELSKDEVVNDTIIEIVEPESMVKLTVEEVIEKSVTADCFMELVNTDIETINEALAIIEAEIESLEADENADQNTLNHMKSSKSVLGRVIDEKNATLHLGDKMTDFTVYGTSGQRFNFSEVLNNNDIVFIVFWKTWCEPCKEMFPFLEEVYEEYKDRIAIVALVTDATDPGDITIDEKMEGYTFFYAKDEGLTLSTALGQKKAPSYTLIDRYGTIVWKKVGGGTKTSFFKTIYERFLGDDYEKSEIETRQYLPGMY